LALCIATCGLANAQPAPQREPIKIWFGPRQDYFDSTTHSVTWTHFDFLGLLRPQAPWQGAARQIDAMMFNVTHASEGFNQVGVPSLPDIRAMLALHQFKAGGGGSVVYTDGLCKGAGVEGMSSDKDFAREVFFTTRTWHDAGLPLSYFTMDSPFFFGYIVMKDKCHFSIEDVARRAATTVKMIRTLYPNIVIIDAEGPGAELPAQWLPEYSRFLAAFRSAYGAPIDYLDMDLHWADSWHTGYRWVTAAKQIVDYVHKQGVRVGLLVNAEDGEWDPDVPPPDPKASPQTAMTAAYWMAAVHKHIDLIKQNAIPLDAVDIGSWMKFPARNLPETDPQSWTSVVNYAHDVLTPSK
jgi:hypothetical protein